MADQGRSVQRGGFRFGEDRDRVKDASDIVRIIGEHVQLKPKGREYLGLCPFHDDHKPSMNVVPHKQIYYCFSCGAGGDVFDFVKNYHKMEFREALQYLAEKAGIELTRHAVGEHQPAGVSRSDLLDAGAMARDYFRAVLRHEEHGRSAREVIARRGITPEMVEHFQLGASADRWDGLLLTIQKQGVPPESLVESGLLKARESGGLYDAFRNRVMFPIHDQIGRVIAFGARKIKDEDEPKYLNSAESRVFNKSATLYGLFQAARSIQAARTAVVTEGYTDTIACHQAGLTNVVATLGTALTRDHASVLRRLCDTVVLLFDGDEAGQRAADRAISVFFAENIDVRIATLDRFTDAKDPDELLKRAGVDGVAVLRRCFEGAVDLLTYRFDRVRGRLAGAGTAALTRAMEEELDALVRMGLNEVQPLRKALVIKHLSSIAGVDEDTIRRVIPTGRSGFSSAQVEAKDAAVPALGLRRLTTPEFLLGCVLTEGALWGTLPASGQDLVLEGEYRLAVLADVAQAVSDCARSGKEPGLKSVLSIMEDEGSRHAAVSLSERIDRETGHSPDRLREAWNDCIRHAEQQGLIRRVSPRRAEDGGGVREQELLEQRRRLHSNLGADNRRYPKPRG